MYANKNPEKRWIVFREREREEGYEWKNEKGNDYSQKNDQCVVCVNDEYSAGKSTSKSLD